MTNEEKLREVVQTLRDDLVAALPKLDKPGYALDVREVIKMLDKALEE
jgi:hypothetical protein